MENSSMNQDGIISNKQNLNLSDYAYGIIENDMCAFQIEKLSGILNLVFRNLCENADASISRRLAEKKSYWEEQFYHEKIRDDGRIIKVLLDDTEKKLVQQMNERVKNDKNGLNGKSFKFYLNKENVDYLTEEFKNDSKWYNDRPMRYVKAVIEEYTRKTPLEREQIIFQKKLKELEHQISSASLTCIQTDSGKFEVKPYAIMVDEDQMFHYFVGISRPVGTSPDYDMPASFRVSRITDYHERAKSYRSGRISIMQRRMLEETIQEKGVAFLLSDSEEVVVFLTEEGMNSYKKYTHLRPGMESYMKNEDGYLCRFKCTEYQIRSYFFKFGDQACIL